MADTHFAISSGAFPFAFTHTNETRGQRVTLGTHTQTYVTSA